jgi:hypothetical protein
VAPRLEALERRPLLIAAAKSSFLRDQRSPSLHRPKIRT